VKLLLLLVGHLQKQTVRAMLQARAKTFRFIGQQLTRTALRRTRTATLPISFQ